MFLLIYKKLFFNKQAAQAPEIGENKGHDCENKNQVVNSVNDSSTVSHVYPKQT